VSGGAFGRLICRIAQVPGGMTLGHYGWPVPAGLAVGLRCTAHSLTDVVAWGLPLAGATVLVAAHSGLLLSCGRCRPRLTPPAGPDDAEAQVARYRWLLRAVHAPWRSLAVWALAGAGLGLTFVAGGRLQPVSAVPVVAFFLLFMVAGPRVHTRLQVACPWCDHHGGGGDGEPVPAPWPGGPDGGQRPEGGVVVGQVPAAVTGGREIVPDFCEELDLLWEGTEPARDPWLAPARSTRPVPGQRRAGGAR
jgi:hypothetical protein